MYQEALGSGRTLQMQRRILPALVWNQEVYGQRILRCLETARRWLDFGCGKRLLAGGWNRLKRRLRGLRLLAWI
jgi:hypothetical protein